MGTSAGCVIVRFFNGGIELFANRLILRSRPFTSNFCYVPHSTRGHAPWQQLWDAGLRGPSPGRFRSALVSLCSGGARGYHTTFRLGIPQTRLDSAFPSVRCSFFV